MLNETFILFKILLFTQYTVYKMFFLIKMYFGSKHAYLRRR